MFFQVAHGFYVDIVACREGKIVPPSSVGDKRQRSLPLDILSDQGQVFLLLWGGLICHWYDGFRISVTMFLTIDLSAHVAIFIERAKSIVLTQICKVIDYQGRNVIMCRFDPSIMGSV